MADFFDTPGLSITQFLPLPLGTDVITLHPHATASPLGDTAFFNGITQTHYDLFHVHLGPHSSIIIICKDLSNREILPTDLIVMC